jgi:hypothetical protein
MPTTVCHQCFKTFYVTPYEIKIGWGKFCSRPCYDNSRRQSLSNRFWRYVAQIETVKIHKVVASSLHLETQSLIEESLKVLAESPIYWRLVQFHLAFGFVIAAMFLCVLIQHISFLGRPLIIHLMLLQKAEWQKVSAMELQSFLNKRYGKSCD